MVKVSAFHSIIPSQIYINQVPTQAYSNYTKKQIEQEIRQNPHSFLNIITNKSTNNQREKFLEIRKKFDLFIERGILKKNPKKAIYIYQQANQNQKYIGIVCAISIKDYADKKIKIHEKTIAKREELFCDYLSSTKMHAEPVLITHDGDMSSFIKSYTTINNKLYDLKTKDNIKHTIWEINETNHIEEISVFFKKISQLYIADGHHRMASSSRYNQDAMCLAYIVSKNELSTHPFHRLVSNIEHPLEILNTLKNRFEMTLIKKPILNSQHIQCYILEKWYSIKLEKPSEKVDLLKSIMASKLTENILKPILKIKDERQSRNVTFIPGHINIEAIVKNTHYSEILFFMNKIDIETIFSIANKGYTTPPKSTYILPKIPSGLIMMELQ